MGALSCMVQGMMLLVAGCVGKTLQTQAADHSPVLEMHLHVALKVCRHTKGFSTFWATLAPHLGV